MNSGEHMTSVARLHQRKLQMLQLIDVRPHWMRSGPCSTGNKLISEAGDVPCPCPDADVSCRIHALTTSEFSRLSK